MKRRWIIRSFFLGLGIVAGLDFGWVYWINWGQHLRYEVYSGGEFWYYEDLSTEGRVLFTTMFGFVAGMVAAASCALVWRKTRPPVKGRAFPVEAKPADGGTIRP